MFLLWIHRHSVRIHEDRTLTAAQLVAGDAMATFWTRAYKQRTLQKKDTSVTFWAERIFFCHTYDTSMTIIVTKPGIIIDVVGSYFYDKKS